MPHLALLWYQFHTVCQQKIKIGSYYYIEEWRNCREKKKRWCGGLRLDTELVSVSQWHTVNVMVICWYRQGNGKRICSGSVYSYQAYLY